MSDFADRPIGSGGAQGSGKLSVVLTFVRQYSLTTEVSTRCSTVV